MKEFFASIFNPTKDLTLNVFNTNEHVESIEISGGNLNLPNVAVTGLVSVSLGKDTSASIKMSKFKPSEDDLKKQNTENNDADNLFNNTVIVPKIRRQVKKLDVIFRNSASELHQNIIPIYNFDFPDNSKENYSENINSQLSRLEDNNGSLGFKLSRRKSLSTSDLSSKDETGNNFGAVFKLCNSVKNLVQPMSKEDINAEENWSKENLNSTSTQNLQL